MKKRRSNSSGAFRKSKPSPTRMGGDCSEKQNAADNKQSAASGDPAGIRTPDTLLKRQVLCLLSYWVIFNSPKRKPTFILEGNLFTHKTKTCFRFERRPLRKVEILAHSTQGQDWNLKKQADVAGMAGLEPTISESKSGVLPLHYIPPRPTAIAS